MARKFEVGAASSRFNLSPKTREYIQALILDLDMDATQVVELAIAQLWQREIEGDDRDWIADLDRTMADVATIKAKLGL